MCKLFGKQFRKLEGFAKTIELAGGAVTKRTYTSEKWLQLKESKSNCFTKCLGPGNKLNFCLY
jgi:hypothetical protein